MHITLTVAEPYPPLGISQAVRLHEARLMLTDEEPRLVEAGMLVPLSIVLTLLVASLSIS